MPNYPIRPATVDDLPFLQEIERAAGLLFAELGMTLVATDEPLALAELERYQAGGRAWVAVDTDDSAVAYLIVDIVGGGTHIEQVSVDPRHAHQGIGLALIEYVAEWSVQRGISRLTLTTFLDVPWNAPYYRRCGFQLVPEREVTAGLREIRRHEAEHGLDRWPRGVMRRELG
ncbi:MAG TPA: GNAT family N-acetyltransferase [Mycobacteriales bacterium]|nr:GNAT family N-acetyltransferase [Mycobacteriales bacterium]